MRLFCLCGSEDCSLRSLGFIDRDLGASNFFGHCPDCEINSAQQNQNYTYKPLNF